jgi:hypothetical protein
MKNKNTVKRDRNRKKEKSDCDNVVRYCVRLQEVGMG